MEFAILALLALFAYFLFKSFNQGGGGNAIQTAKDAVQGVASAVQGAKESGSSIYHDFFGSNDSQEYDPATALAIDNFDATYQIDPVAYKNFVLNAVPDLENYIQQVRSDPTVLPFF